ncbi:hypothetical protein QTP88_017089 [Uroleucon formosanum]
MVQVQNVQHKRHRVYNKSYTKEEDRCVKNRFDGHRGCLSKLYLDECSTVIFRCELTHEHEEPRNLSQKIISNSAKTKAADQGIYRPLKIIREEIVNALVELTQQLNSIAQRYAAAAAAGDPKTINREKKAINVNSYLYKWSAIMAWTNTI